MIDFKKFLVAYNKLPYKWQFTSQNIVTRFIIFLGIILRTRNLLSSPELWADEIFSVSVAESPFFDVILAVLRYDVHPPLYYLQLHIWGLFGKSDLWYLANSFVLNVAAILAIYVTCRLRYGAIPALWAAAAMAILPQQFFFADNVRMYNLSAILAIWLWYLLHVHLEGPDKTTRLRLIGIGLVGIALTLTHGLGFFVTFFVFLWAFTNLLHRRTHAKEIRRLIYCYAIVAVFAGYSLVVGSIRSTIGTEDLIPDMVGIHLALSLLGHNAPAPVFTGYVAALVLLVLPLLVSQSRDVGFWLVMLPLLTLLVLSVLIKPVFLFRTIGLFAPFLAVSLGLTVKALVDRHFAWRVTVGVVALVLAVHAVNHSFTYEKSGYRAFAQAWRDRAAPDAIFATESSIVHYWGFIRYVDHIALRSALEVQLPVRDGMLALKRRLDGTPLERLGFFGQAERVEVGEQWFQPRLPSREEASGRQLWLILPRHLGCDAYGRRTIDTLVEGQLRLFVCAADAG